MWIKHGAKIFSIIVRRVQRRTATNKCMQCNWTSIVNTLNALELHLHSWSEWDTAFAVGHFCWYFFFVHAEFWCTKPAREKKKRERERAHAFGVQSYNDDFFCRLESCFGFIWLAISHILYCDYILVLQNAHAHRTKSDETCPEICRCRWPNYAFNRKEK